MTTAQARGGTVILIGGQMTVDGGSTFDSRQPVDGDEDSSVMLRAMGTSLLWWRTAISLVMPILENAGPDAFALVIGQRSVIELGPDGASRRTPLRLLLPGGASEVELVRSAMNEPLPEGYEKAAGLRNWAKDDMGTVGFRRGTSGTRWRFVKGNDWYLEKAGRAIGATVVVDTTRWYLPEGYHAYHLNSLEASRLFSPESVLIAPHTYGAGQHFQAYEQWVREGRRPDSQPKWIEPEVPPAWDPDARRNPILYTTPVPISADFGVTGLLVEAQWHDPADLEAARSLLEARYDLKIGIWDLASNPTLRQTLLDSTPVVPAPPVAAPLPGAALRRAESLVDKKMADRAAAKETWSGITARLAPLVAAGWSDTTRSARFMYSLVLADAPGYEPTDERITLVRLTLEVMKRQATVSVFMAMYNQIDLRTYLTARWPQFEEIAAPERCALTQPWSELWRDSGGWADEVDWDARALRLAAMTPRWSDLLAELGVECHRVRRQQGYQWG